MSYQPEKRTDHTERGPTRLIEQFRRKPILTALLSSYLARVQDLENAAWELILSRSIEAGEGETLDMIGRIVQAPPRGILLDDAFRIVLRARIAILLSRGRPEDIVKVVRLSLPVAKRPYFRVREYSVATFLVDILTGVTWNIALAFANANQTRAGGVRLLMRYPTTDTAHTFTLTDSYPVRTMTTGLTDYGSVFGGKMSTVLASENTTNA